MFQSQVETKKIFVHNRDLGFWTQQEMTVQRFDETSECCGAVVTAGFCMDCKEHAEPRHELIWCNHAGAVEETVQNETYRQDQPDIVWTSKIVVCDKANCGAYKLEGDDWWQDAPFEGVTQ